MKSILELKLLFEAIKCVRTEASGSNDPRVQEEAFMRLQALYSVLGSEINDNIKLLERVTNEEENQEENKAA